VVQVRCGREAFTVSFVLLEGPEQASMSPDSPAQAGGVLSRGVPFVGRCFTMWSGLRCSTSTGLTQTVEPVYGFRL
jgi:hypothetical protein